MPRNLWLLTNLLLVGALQTGLPVRTVVGQEDGTPMSRQWGGDKRFVEEISVGGDAADEEELLGYIVCVAVDNSGGIYLFDALAPRLKFYDKEGRFVRNVGQVGQGPGEYQDDCQGIVVRRDGSVALRDNRNMRVHIYESDGSIRASVVHRSGFSSQATLLLAPADHLFLKAVLGPTLEGRPWPIGLIRIDHLGTVVDTLYAPRIEGEPSSPEHLFQPAKIWTVMPDGTTIVGLNRSYTIEIRKPDSTVVVINRSYRPVRFEPRERIEYERRHEWLRSRRRTTIPRLPELKPAFRAIFVDRDSRIWVQLYGKAKVVERGSDPNGPPAINFAEPTAFDVFDSRDGGYLGRVHAPDDFWFVDATGDTVWGRSKDARGYHTVLRGQLVDY